ncbi:MAG: hypothetical protein WC635_01030 [Bacteriovorax sp.]|jgi:hypothetical protein
MKLMSSFLLLATLMTIQPSFAQSVIDLKEEGKQFLGLSNKYLKTISEGQGITYSFERPQYVERVLISAIGEQRDFSFVKVYADGDEVGTLGVPGKDPDYPIIIRGNVSSLTLKAQNNSRVKILDFKIFTERKEYSSYNSVPRTQRAKYSMSDWGGKILDIALEIEYLRRVDSKISMEDVKKHVLPAKKVAFKLQAADNVRDARSLNTKEKALELVGAINSALDLFQLDAFLLDSRYDMIILDLNTIKQDIGEKYDINVD